MLQLEQIKRQEKETTEEMDDLSERVSKIRKNFSHQLDRIKDRKFEVNQDLRVYKENISRLKEKSE